MVRNKWTDGENLILKLWYGKIQNGDIKELLPNRTIAAIKIHANILGLKYFQKRSHDYVKSNLKCLLKENVNSYYWIGFLLADGSFTESRLKLFLAKKDKDHIQKFGEFISCDNFQSTNNSYGITAQDKYLIPKVLKKFDIKKKKTYNPPNFNWKNSELFFALCIGFIDGDGCLGKQTGRNDCSLRIKNHVSWSNFLKSISSFISNRYDSRVRIPYVNKQGYVLLEITNNTILRAMKKDVISLNLPVLHRKWSKVNENIISRYITSKINKDKGISLLTQGYKPVEVAKLCGLSKSWVSKIKKEMI